MTPLQRVGRAAHDFFADGGRSGKCNFVDSGMPHDGFANFRTAGDDVHHARGNARFDRQFSKTQRGERSLLGGLQHDRIAARQRRTQFPRRQQQREIPRNDQADHADRLAQGVGESVLERVDGLAMNLGRPARVVAQNVDHHRHVDVARFENRFAVVERFQLGKFVDVLLDQIGQTPDQTPALAGRHFAPWSAAIFKRLAGSVNGAVDIGCEKLRPTWVSTSPVAGLMVSNCLRSRRSTGRRSAGVRVRSSLW